MVKMIFLCRRRPELTRERYAELILRGHVPLALKHHPTMRRYAVNVVEGEVEGRLDSIAALSFDSLADYLERLYDSPEGREIIGRDVEGFLGGAAAYATHEVVHRDDVPASPLGQRTPGVKWICPLARRPGMSHEEFVAHWLGEHVPLALKHQPAITRFATNAVEKKLGDAGEDWDGFAEIQFAGDTGPRERFTDSPEGAKALEADHARFVGRSLVVPVAEYVQK